MPETIIIDMSIIMGWFVGIMALCGVMWGARKAIKTINRS